MAQQDKIRPILVREMTRFGIDEDGRICIDGQPIEVKVKGMTLTKWQAIVAASTAVIGSLSAASIAILQVLDRL